MYVCVCFAVTDSEVRAAIEAGATTQDLVTKACRAGGDCGACHGMVREMIEEHLEDMAAPSSGAKRLPELVAAEDLVRRHRAA